MLGRKKWVNVQRQLNQYAFQFVGWEKRGTKKMSLHKVPDGFCTCPGDIKRKDSPSSSAQKKTKSRRSPSPALDSSDSKTSQNGTDGFSAIEIYSPEPSSPVLPEKLSNNQLTGAKITSKAPSSQFSRTSSDAFSNDWTKLHQITIGTSLFGTNMNGSVSMNNLDTLDEDGEHGDKAFLALDLLECPPFTSSHKAQASPIACPSPNFPCHQSNKGMSFSNSGSSDSIGGVNKFNRPSQLRQSSDTAFEARQNTTLFPPSGTEPLPIASEEEMQEPLHISSEEEIQCWLALLTH